MERRTFLRNSLALTSTLLLSPVLLPAAQKEKLLIGVQGPIAPEDLGVTLIHEHLLVDFIGAAQTGPHRYDANEVFNNVLPYLLEVKKAGCTTFVDCTPAYLGRDVRLLKRLAAASGINIITNTGYYGAVGGKFLPTHAHTESAQQLAGRWIDEWKNGIEGSGIYPGFIKTSVEDAPLKPIHKKLLTAAAITHLQTGLSISAHTGNGAAALEEIAILQNGGVHPSAFRWVHAQKEKDRDLHVRIAKTGAWVELDEVRPAVIAEYVDMLRHMKKNGVLHRTLISHDAGWYNVGDPKGGTDFVAFTTIFDTLLPALRKEGFTTAEIDQLLKNNPLESLAINIRKS